MEGQFSLRPFPTADPIPDLTVGGNIVRQSGMLSVRYELLGCLGEIAIPVRANEAVRKHGLWNETCLELFATPANSPEYWEFNLSPAGHWNVYRFAGYRQEMEEDPVFRSLPFVVKLGPNSLSLALELDLNKIVLTDKTIEIGISAVIKHRTGEKSYWALLHCGPQPDFHRRESFTLIAKK